MRRPRRPTRLSRARFLRLSAGAALAAAALPSLARAEEDGPSAPEPMPEEPPPDEPVEAPAGDETPAEPQPQSAPFALLDGTLLSQEQAWSVNTRLPVAVIIDNLPAGARPQAGLDQADLVYELLVEGGITRFLAVYHRREAGLIEPVRSVRTPFLYPVSELDAILAHVGAAELAGPADAGSQMRDWGIRHLDEAVHPGVFTRDRARVAPHNAITSTAWLRAHADELGWAGPPALQPWTFKEDWAAPNPAEESAGRISYAFGGPLPPQPAFAVDWYFDAASNSYARAMAGAWHTDARSGRVLYARNVVVQFDTAALVDYEGHLLYGSVGQGPAYIFQDGQVVTATWTKPDRTARTRYLDRDGAEVAFNRGPTWVSVLPFTSPLSWE